MKIDLSILNKDQLAAVTHEEGPLLVMAGAGSGKTRVLTYRAAWLIQNRGVNESEIVLLTFTNKAAGEMKERVKKILGNEVKLGFTGTFHTFCAKILRNYGSYINIGPDYIIYDSEDSEKTMREVLKEQGVDTKETNPKMFLGLIGKMKNDLKTIDQVEKENHDYFYRQVVKMWKIYQEKLRRNKALDFDDLLIKAVEILRKPEIQKIVNNNLRWILVDEYQDTNKAQFEITRLLAGENKNITAVGDASQAIYSFRGADFRNLALLQNEFEDLKTISLPTNYRSTQHILDGAYGVVRKNTSHPTIKLEAVRDVGEKIVLLEAADEKDEAKFVVNECKIISDKGEEVAILYRTNAQSRTFEDELMKRDIPYKLVGGLRFYSRAEVKDLIAYLRLVNNPEEEISKQRIEKIGKRKARQFFDWLENNQSAVVSEKPSQLMEEIINVTNYLDKFDERDEEDASRIENINELLAVSLNFETLGDFLESAALSESEIKQHKSKALITLMTVHAAKGLEFKNVFVVGLEEGLFPHSRSMFEGGKEEIEEERRLMYVAMTRAEEKLSLSFARSRLVFGGRHSTIPSRFLSEIPSESIKTNDRGTKRNTTANRDNFIDEFGDKKRIIVQDWEIDQETKDDFSDIDNW